MSPDEARTQGGPGEAESDAGDSIWLEGAPSSYEEVEARISRLWPPDVEVPGRDLGQGGKLFRLHGAGPSFSTARLQKFAIALAGNLRYQTVEIFLSRPVVGSDHADPVMVAAAFRQDAKTTGRAALRDDSKDGRRRHPWKWRGTADLSVSGLKPLRRLLLSGEDASILLDRMRCYVDRRDLDLVEFVNYVASASCVAMLIRNVSETEGPAPVLWDLLAPIRYGKGSRGLPTNEVRDSLRRLTELYGDMLIEDGTSCDQLVSSLRSDQSLPPAQSTYAFEEAAELWLALSDFGRVSKALDPLVKKCKLPTSVVRLLFEAPVRSYPLWLRSATLEVWDKRTPVLHGDLHQEVDAAGGKRNKRVNYLTLQAYERAAHRILFPSGEKGRGLLRSMLLFPFSVVGHSGEEARGFVRFMNRFSGEGKTQRLFDYPMTNGSWHPRSDEKMLGLAVTALLSEKLAELGLMHGAELTSRARTFLVAPESSAAVPAAAAEVVTTSSVEMVGIGDRLLLLGRLLSDTHWLTPERWRDVGLIGSSPRMVQLRELIAKCAGSEETVYIFGESGSGKEVVAKAVHRLSSRSEGPFIALNISSYPDGMVEGELFGYKRGAFTGASTDRVGEFVKAHKGTLFLDEVTEIPLQLQVKFLRVLQEREVAPLGPSSRAMEVDFRLISASNRSLEKAVAAGLFREDLFYRLKVLKIVVPPLRERKDDIVELVGWILKKLGVTLTPTRSFLRCLEKYDWPGNIRQLENALRSAKVMAGSSQLNVEHLPESIRA